MSEEQDNKLGRPDSEFPTTHFPSIFADGALSHVNSMGISKFYLYRLDPNMFARGGLATTPTVQVNMPTHGFVAMAAFFHERVQFLIKNKVVTQKEWDDTLEGQRKADRARAEGPDRL